MNACNRVLFGLKSSNTRHRARKMAEQRKVFATKLDNLGSIPETYIVGWKNQIPTRCPLTGRHTHTYMHTCRINSK